MNTRFALPLVAILCASAGVASADPRATLLEPRNGSTLSGESVAFRWTPVGATGHFLYLGTSQGARDLYARSLGAKTSCTVGGLPRDGRRVYARLYSQVAGRWYAKDYVFYAARASRPLRILSPASGTSLDSSRAAFRWEAGADAYVLYLGTRRGGSDLYRAGIGKGTAITVANLPTNGSLLYARLFASRAGAWSYTDAVYASARVAPQRKAVLVAPRNGSRLSGARADFEWSDAQAKGYFLTIGRQRGARDVFSGAATSRNRLSVSGLPRDGSLLWVRLYTQISGSWQSNDYVLYAERQAQPSELTAPPAGSTLPGSTANFAWSRGEASAFHLVVRVGQRVIYSRSMGAQTSARVDGLPTTGGGLEVDLYARVGQGWVKTSAAYRAHSQPKAVAARLQSPAGGSALTASSATFRWSETPSGRYHLTIGTRPGGVEVFSRGISRATSTEVRELPTNGAPLHVRLYSLVGSSWEWQDSVVRAVLERSVSPATLESPRDGSTLEDRRVTFRWRLSAADGYRLRVGSRSGAHDLLVRSFDARTDQYVVSGLPANGSAVYLALDSLIKGSWQTKSYVFKAHTENDPIAELIAPREGTRLAARETFRWNDVGAGGYELWLGTGRGEGNILLAKLGRGQTSYEVRTLPHTGGTLHVGLRTQQRNGGYVGKGYTFTLPAKIESSFTYEGDQPKASPKPSPSPKKIESSFTYEGDQPKASPKPSPSPKKIESSFTYEGDQPKASPTPNEAAARTKTPQPVAPRSASGGLHGVARSNAPPSPADALAVETTGLRCQLSGRLVDSDSDLVKVEVNWGDGGASATKLSNSRKFALTHRYPRPGIYVVYLTVFDQHGSDSPTTNLKIRVLDPPNTADLKAAAPPFEQVLRARLWLRQAAKSLQLRGLDRLRGENGLGTNGPETQAFLRYYSGNLSPGKIHPGVDLGYSAGDPIYAGVFGVVTKHQNGRTSVYVPVHDVTVHYLHMRAAKASTLVFPSTLLGHVSGYAVGGSNPSAFPKHLHVEVLPGNAEKVIGPNTQGKVQDLAYNPVAYFNGLKIDVSVNKTEVRQHSAEEPLETTFVLQPFPVVQGAKPTPTLFQRLGLTGEEAPATVKLNAIAVALHKADATRTTSLGFELNLAVWTPPKGENGEPGVIELTQPVRKTTSNTISLTPGVYDLVFKVHVGDAWVHLHSQTMRVTK